MKTKRKLDTELEMKISKHKVNLALERYVRPLSVSERPIDSKIADSTKSQEPTSEY